MSKYDELKELANAQSHPLIARYRDTLKSAVGLSAKKFPQSNESLYKRLLKEAKPFRPINPLVDFYNAISIKHGVTAGAFDLDELASLFKGEDEGATLELRLTDVKDSFLALDAGSNSSPVDVASGELAYTRGNLVLTRHLAWRQSIQGLVKAETKNVVFVSEIFNERVCADVTALATEVERSLVEGLKTYFDVEASVHTVLGSGLAKLSTTL